MAGLRQVVIAPGETTRCASLATAGKGDDRDDGSVTTAMTGAFGIGGVLAGFCLWCSAHSVVPALSRCLGSLGYCAPALPGVLMLLGTVLLGVALIRMQER